MCKTISIVNKFNTTANFIKSRVLFIGVLYLWMEEVKQTFILCLKEEGKTKFPILQENSVEVEIHLASVAEGKYSFL